MAGKKYWASIQKRYIDNKEEIIKLYNEGHSAKELGNIYKICRITIVNYLRVDGVSIREGRGKHVTDITKKRNTEAFVKKYGVLNAGQINNPIMQKRKSDKLKAYRKNLGLWKGENNPNFGNKIGNNFGFKYGRRKDLNNIFFRSSWEANVARMFNFLHIEWRYECVRFKIDTDHSITPDFYLPRFKAFIEVKGFWRRDAKEKWARLNNLYNLRSLLVGKSEYEWLIHRYSKVIENLEK